MLSLLRSVLLISSILVLNAKGQANPGGANPPQVGVHRRFEYKYSFKPPYLAQKDGTVPFWEYGGSKYNNSNNKTHRHVSGNTSAR